MKCPICEKGNASLVIEKKKRIFRKEEFVLFEYFYKCNTCKEEFTTTEIDTINTNQVYNQYRSKHSIPFPQQLTAIREKYNLSAAKMSEILGLGTNQFRLYEEGEMPSLSNGTLLSIILSPNDFKDIISRKKDFIKNSDRLLIYLDELIKNENSFDADLKSFLFDSTIIPNKYTGFTIPNFEKFANMVLFFISNAPFKTRLNKLLFYSDFVNYKYSGFSISGCKYAALPMGSVPNDYSLIFGLLESDNYLTTELITIKDKENEKFVPLKSFDTGLFSSTEINILEKVIKKFKSLPTKEIMDISHNEKAWKDNIKNKSIIDFSIYAPQLIAL